MKCYIIRIYTPLTIFIEYHLKHYCNEKNPETDSVIVQTRLTFIKQICFVVFIVIIVFLNMTDAFFGNGELGNQLNAVCFL